MADIVLKTVDEAKKWLGEQIAAAPPALKGAYKDFLDNVEKLYQDGKPLVVRDGKLDLTGLNEKTAVLGTELSNKLAAAGKTLKEGGRALYDVMAPAAGAAADAAKDATKEGSFLGDNKFGLIGGIVAFMAAMFLGDMGILPALLIGLLGFGAGSYFGDDKGVVNGLVNGNEKKVESPERERARGRGTSHAVGGSEPSRFAYGTAIDNKTPSDAQKAAGIESQHMLHVSDTNLAFDGDVILHGKMSEDKKSFTVTGYELIAAGKNGPGTYKKYDGVVRLDNKEDFAKIFSDDHIGKTAKEVNAKIYAEVSTGGPQVDIQQKDNVLLMTTRQLTSDKKLVTTTIGGRVEGTKLKDGKRLITMGDKTIIEPISELELTTVMTDGKVDPAKLTAFLKEDLKPEKAGELAKKFGPAPAGPGASLPPGSPVIPGASPPPPSGGPGAGAAPPGAGAGAGR